MPKVFSPSLWKASKEGANWVMIGPSNAVVARLEGKANTEKTAKLIAASPCMLDALRGVLRLAGDDDLAAACYTQFKRDSK